MNAKRTFCRLVFPLVLLVAACDDEAESIVVRLDANTSGSSMDGGIDVPVSSRLDAADSGAMDAVAAQDAKSADASADTAKTDAAGDAGVVPVTVNFETVAGVTPGPISGTVPATARLSNQLQPTYGVSFRSLDKPYVALVNLGVGHATSGPNGIGSVSATDTMAYSTMAITFSMPAEAAVAAATSRVSIRGDRNAIAGTATLEGFDVNQQSLGKVTVNDIAGGLTLELVKPNINSIVLTQVSHTIGFDDLIFEPLSPAGI